MTEISGKPSPQSRTDAALFAAIDGWAQLRHRRLLRWTRSQEVVDNRRIKVALPRAMNDKWVWRKIFDRDPRFVTVSDKLAMRAWAERFGLETPRVLWQGCDGRDIPAELLNQEVVVKSNHGSGRNIFLSGGAPAREEVIAQTARFMRRDYGRRQGQWAYAAIPRRIFVEEFLGACGLEELKIYTYGRHIERVFRVVDRFGERGAAMLEDSGAGLEPYTTRIHSFERHHDGPWPSTLSEAMEAARRIGAEFDAMRVDFLTDGSRLWLNELTVYDQGGFREYDGHLPDTEPALRWDLRRSWFMRTPQRGWREAYRRALGRALEAAA